MNDKKIWLGAAYYPEAWTDEVMDDDIAKMKEIGVNVVRMAEFAWSTMEREEGVFDFSVFKKVVRKMAENGIDVVMCTPSATPPKWLTDKYEETLMMNDNGRRKQFGGRCHPCKSSPVMREKNRINVDEIISVRSADLQTKYAEGVDYEIQDGKLVVLEDGNIPILNYDRMYFETNPGEAGSGNTVEGNENVEAFPTVDGKYEIYEEAGILYQHQIAVTYYHKDKGNYTVPMGQSREFDGLIDKLERGESVNIVCLGDSISNGSSASGFFSNKLNPAMPSYFGLVGDYIKAKYRYQRVYLYEDPTHYVADKENEPTRIKMTNFSVGGKDSYWGVTQAAAVAAKNPDLVILGFGMNDGSAYTGETAYYNNMLSMITEIRKTNPNCEFVVLGTMLPNAKICWNVGGASIYGNQEKYLPKLQKLAQEEAGVALADITTLHKEYLGVKNYRDMTGNNVNHPNDFLMRLYAQTIVKTIFG